MADNQRAMRESVSALMDGELSQREATDVLAHMDAKDGYPAWQLYHHIGDVLRADGQSAVLSETFEARLQARLEKEMYVAVTEPRETPAPGKKRRFRGLLAGWGAITVYGIGLPAICAMAMLVLVAIGAHIAYDVDAGKENKADVIAEVGAGKVADTDTHLEDYVAAHRRLSPALYSADESSVTDVVVAGNN